MDGSFLVTFESDHVRVVTDAEKNLAVSTTLWTEIAAMCEKHDCFTVLAVSDAPAPMPMTDGFSHAELFRKLGITSKYRIAWAELNDDARSATEFVETVLNNRSLPGKVFATEAEARRWLFS
jgi:hypothetical protein